MEREDVLEALKEIYPFADCRETRGCFTERSKAADINLSSEWTVLVKEAAKCEAYSSDIFYDYDNVMSWIDPENIGSRKTFFIAFRDMGVDGNTFIAARLRDIVAAYKNGHMDRNEMEKYILKMYSAIYRFDIDLSQGDITVRFGKIF